MATPQPSALTDAAAVVTFGARALGLARSTLPLPAESLATDPVDPNQIADARLRGVAPGETEPVLASVIGPGVSNPAILNALGANARAARLIRPGALDPESGLFRDPVPLESGFFPSPDAAVDAALLRPLADQTFESTFPRAAAQNDLFEPSFPRAPDASRLESGFFRSLDAAPGPLVSDELASAFPRAPAPSADLGPAFPRALAADDALAPNDVLESGLPRSLAQDDGLAPAFPRPPAGNESLAPAFPRALAADDPLAPAFPRALAADDPGEAGLFRAPGSSEAAYPTLAPQSARSIFERAPVDATQEASRATIANAQTLFTGAPVVPSTSSAFPDVDGAGLQPIGAAPAVVAVLAARAAGNTLDPTAPRTQAAGTEATPFRDPLAPNSDSPSARTPAANSETALRRPPVANNTEAGLFRPPAGEGPVTSRQGDTYANPAPAGVRAGARPEQQLNTQERRELQTLERNERAVRSDELAQRAAAGGYADGVRVRYQMGPDGRRYAVDSQVSFDVTPVAGDPAATLRKMEVVSRAANAAANPSATDRSAAAEAQQLMRQARAQLAAERYSEESDRFAR